MFGSEADAPRSATDAFTAAAAQPRSASPKRQMPPCLAVAGRELPRPWNSVNSKLRQCFHPKDHRLSYNRKMKPVYSAGPPKILCLIGSARRPSDISIPSGSISPKPHHFQHEIEWHGDLNTCGRNDTKMCLLSVCDRLRFGKKTVHFSARVHSGLVYPQCLFDLRTGRHNYRAHYGKANPTSDLNRV